MNKSTIVIVAFIIVIGTYSTIAYYKNKSLFKRHQLMRGTVTQCQFLPKTGGDISISYEYKIGDSYFYGSESSKDITINDCEIYLIGRTFPLLYDSTDKESSLLLITPKHFKRVNYNFPDSQKWILRHIK